jgi:hypothetical protein
MEWKRNRVFFVALLFAFCQDFDDLYQIVFSVLCIEFTQ